MERVFSTEFQEQIRRTLLINDKNNGKLVEV